MITALTHFLSLETHLPALAGRMAVATLVGLGLLVPLAGYAVYAVKVIPDGQRSPVAQAIYGFAALATTVLLQPVTLASGMALANVVWRL